MKYRKKEYKTLRWKNECCNFDYISVDDGNLGIIT